MSNDLTNAQVALQCAARVVAACSRGGVTSTSSDAIEVAGRFLTWLNQNTPYTLSK